MNLCLNRGVSAALMQRTAGFSLVELSLAIGVFAFAVLSMLAMVQGLLSQTSDSRHESRATLIASQILGDLSSPGETPPFVLQGPDITTDISLVDFNAAASYSVDFDGEGEVVVAGSAGALYRAVVNIEPVSGRTHFAHVTIFVRTPPDRTTGKSFQFKSAVSSRSTSTPPSAP